MSAASPLSFPPLPLPPAGVEEDDLGGVYLGAVAPLPVVALPGVLDQASGDVDAVALADVLVHRLGLLAPADDVVPVGLDLPVLAAALGGQPQLGDGGAASRCKVGRRRVTPVARSTFPSAPSRTGRAAFTASGSPVVISAYAVANYLRGRSGGMVFRRLVAIICIHRGCSPWPLTFRSRRARTWWTCTSTVDPHISHSFARSLCISSLRSNLYR